MVDIDKALGIEQIMADADRLEELKRQIMNDVRYVTPGYEKDYYLHTFGRRVEFQLCRWPDGSEEGIAVHVCGGNEIDLVFDRVLSTEESTHFYLMHAQGSDSLLPVRIVCPDVLAGPKPGDIIHGQTVALTETVFLRPDSPCSTVDIGENCVEIVGEIVYIREYDFAFSDLSVEYWDMTVDTSIGRISVFVRKNAISFTPARGQHISLEAILSFDVALSPPLYSGKDEDLYRDAAFHHEFPQNCGFIPSPENAERVLESCFITGRFHRFRRACAEKIDIQWRGKVFCVRNSRISEWFDAGFSTGTLECEITQVLSGKDHAYIGQDVLTIRENGNIEELVHIAVDHSGFVNQIRFLESSAYSLGLDAELHALTKLVQNMCSGRIYCLWGSLAENCIYRSEDADCRYLGIDKIIRGLDGVVKRIGEANPYTYEVLPAFDVLCEKDDLPEIYRGNWCARLYHNMKLAAVVFIQIDYSGRIKNILLSRNGNFVKDFARERRSAAANDAKPVNVRELLEWYYGSTDTLQKMRNAETPDEDETGISIWKEADAYMVAWLGWRECSVSASEIEEDCIGYAWTYKGREYAVFCYTCEPWKHFRIDATYCQRLRSYPISSNRTIAVVYLQCRVIPAENGGKQYRFGRYDRWESPPEMWLFDRVNGKDILHRNPHLFISDTVTRHDMITRFMSAYNAQDLDLLKALLTEDAQIIDREGGCTMNSAVYNHLAYLHKENGKMRTAYVRYKDVVYSMVPYLEDYGYFTFRITNDANRICDISEHALDGSYRDLLITEDIPENVPSNRYPALVSVEFLSASCTSRFSARLTFDNGETRRYDFPVKENAEQEQNAEVVEISHFSFTDRIFRHGKIVDHIDMPDWFGERNYPQRGQGLSFVNGYSISTAELYFSSHPLE